MPEPKARYVIEEGHEIIGSFCHGCGEEFVAGMHLTLVPIGPGPDLEGRRLAREGQPYTMATLAVCWPCATGEEPS